MRNAAFLTLHVDDGTFVGDRSDKAYQDPPRGINSKLNVKEWADLKGGEVADYSGTQWRQCGQAVTLDMDTCIKVKRAGVDLPKLDVAGVQVFRSVLAKACWPVNVVPELAHAVSSLAQVSPQALDWDRVRQLNLVVRVLT